MFIMSIYTDFCYVYCYCWRRQRRMTTTASSAYISNRSIMWWRAKKWRAFFYRARFSITSWDPDRFSATNQNAIYSIFARIVNRKMPLINGTAYKHFVVVVVHCFSPFNSFMCYREHWDFKRNQFFSNVFVPSIFSQYFPHSTMIHEIFSGGCNCMCICIKSTAPRRTQHSLLSIYHYYPHACDSVDMR